MAKKKARSGIDLRIVEGRILMCMVGCELLEFEEGVLTPCLMLAPNDAAELASTLMELAMHGDIGSMENSEDEDYNSDGRRF
jgi:hypothetical protein